MAILIAANEPESLNWLVILPVYLTLVISIALPIFLHHLSQDATTKSNAMQFDHRLRLEKEYELYSTLWTLLFELRRSLGQKVADFSMSNEVRHDEKVLQNFNAYRTNVRQWEPFIAECVFQPANELASIAHRVITNIGKTMEIDDRRSTANSAGYDEGLAHQQVGLDEANDGLWNQFEAQVSRLRDAIRGRVTVNL